MFGVCVCLVCGRVFVAVFPVLGVGFGLFVSAVGFVFNLVWLAALMVCFVFAICW